MSFLVVQQLECSILERPDLLPFLNVSCVVAETNLFLVVQPLEYYILEGADLVDFLKVIISA